MRKLWGILAAAAGFTAGLLFAKKSGKELRKELHKAKSGTEAAEKMGKAYLDAAGEAIEEAKDVMGSKEVKKYLKEGKKKWGSVSEEAKKKGEELLKEAKEKGAEVWEGAKKKAKEIKKKYEK